MLLAAVAITHMNLSSFRTLLGLLIALGAPLALRADNIVFNTVLDTVTTNGSISRLGGPGCHIVFMDPNEDCVIILTAPEIGTGPISNVSLFAALSKPADLTTVAATARATTAFLPFPPFFSYYDLDFFAAVNAMNPCSSVGGCIGPENGGLQQLFTVNWVDHSGDVVSSDTISIDSGLPTPEPSSLKWLLTAISVMVLGVRRSLRARVTH